jgi:hypothetical protein
MVFSIQRFLAELVDPFYSYRFWKDRSKHPRLRQDAQVFDNVSVESNS